MSDFHRIIIVADGVLAAFPEAVLSLFGKDESVIQQGNPEMSDWLGVSSEEMWNKIRDTKSFWRDLKTYPWSESLQKACSLWGCTSISLGDSHSPDVVCQRFHWGAKNLHELQHAVNDDLLAKARSESVLISDSSTLTSMFRAAGGWAILFPTLWNENWVARSVSDWRPVSYVCTELELIHHTVAAFQERNHTALAYRLRMNNKKGE